MTKKKKKSGGNSSKESMIQKWNGYWEPGFKHSKGAKKGKVSVGKAIIKPLSGLTAGAAGAGFGALGGSWSPWIGLGLLIAGQLIPDKSRLISIMGASIMSWGIARGMQNRAADEAGTVDGFGSLSGAKERLTDFKDNLMKAFHLDKLTGSSDESQSSEEPALGSIDLGPLDAWEHKTKESAYNFEMRRVQEEALNDLEEEEEVEEEFEVAEPMAEADEFIIYDEEVEPIEGLSFSYDEEVDFATL